MNTAMMVKYALAEYYASASPARRNQRTRESCARSQATAMAMFQVRHNVHIKEVILLRHCRGVPRVP